MHQFLGVPFAAPPVGDLRWRPPAEHPGWKLSRNAFVSERPCAQDPRGIIAGFASTSNSEDCLYLDVYAPKDTDPGAKLPVMVWFHSGGLHFGSGTGYWPDALVKKGGVVFVAVNYRLNLFGFFSHPAINAEDHPIGNYGFMDQQMGLRWVRDNIAGFGGDPDCVTIFGESAGAVSTWVHMASPGSAGLFSRAITQSGGITPMFDTPRTEEFEYVGEDIAKTLGCDMSAESLRAMPASDILAANTGTGAVSSKHFLIQTVDGQVIPAPMREIFTSGRFNKVPLINGTTRQEFNWFQAMFELGGLEVTASTYSQVLPVAFQEQVLRTISGVSPNEEDMQRILARYPLSAFPDAPTAMATAIGDCGFATLGNRQINRVVRQYNEHVYAYEFDVPDSPVPWPDVSFAYGSAHTLELQYLFPGFCGSSEFAEELTEEQKQLSDTMVEYWTTFARLGTPNAKVPRNPIWSPVDPARDNFMNLTTPNVKEMEDYGQSHQCDFWEKIHKSKSSKI
jgi:para-nitrobenzyl esterase